MGRKPDGISEEADRAPREFDLQAFTSLFRDAYQKCFSTAFTAPLTESESHRLSVEIAESTGLEIGWKSLKNYSSYLVARTPRNVRDYPVFLPRFSHWRSLQYSRCSSSSPADVLTRATAASWTNSTTCPT
ncbi:MAG: hypothetical protein ABI625_25465, partial [bacterium]